MKKYKNKLATYMVNVVLIILIIICFACTFAVVRRYGEKNCFGRIAETTAQIGKMFVHAMENNQNKLTVFADVLGRNSSNTDEYLQDLMKKFCETQSFTSVCIHRADGTIVSSKNPPHDLAGFEAFEEEIERLPYTSDTISAGEKTEEKYVYQAVPIIQNDKTAGILYGYISLKDFPSFIDSTAYDGRCQFYIVDGNTGEFMMDEYHGYLGNIFDGSTKDRINKRGFDMNTMREGIHNGASGYHIFLSERTGEWYYTRYQPLGINNWSMQLTIDEPTAFASYMEINKIMTVLAAVVVFLMIIYIYILMLQTQYVKNEDRARLHRSNYISKIQRLLLKTHINSEMLGQVLRIIAAEVGSDTVLLFSFKNMMINNIYCWPDKASAIIKDLSGRNIKKDFSGLYDLMAEGSGISLDREKLLEIFPKNSCTFLEFRNIKKVCLVPVSDNDGLWKGVLCVVNPEQEMVTDVLECVIYDFFMTLTNLENIETIRKLGTIDCMTRIKNRNSYETELSNYTETDCKNLWCMFVDVNGLHELNNTQGHKAGDLMLCEVAEAMQRIFGKECTYRIGGDEFIAFAMDSSEEQMVLWKRDIMESLAVKGYHVSVGFKGVGKNSNGVFEVEHVVAQAESVMYEEKRNYYNGNNFLGIRFNDGPR